MNVNITNADIFIVKNVGTIFSTKNSSAFDNVISIY